MEIDQEQNISRKPKDEEISIRRIRINTESKPVVVSDTVNCNSNSVSGQRV